jgi:5-methylthioadenosine/S-adenosylhomocysteine deaminase
VKRVLSADWVLPVEGPPIEDGAIVIEDGLIAAVGKADDLGEGTRYDDAVIVPGFVNAHSHLEYAVCGGFGDGLGDFAEWITCTSSARRGSTGTGMSTSRSSEPHSASRQV